MLKTDVEVSGATISIQSLPQVRADGAQLGQLFQNLIANALKFRTEAPPKILVCAEQGDALDVTFAVSDNGIGIAPEFASKIFIPFRRLHRADDFDGTGLGLATAAKIVARHGGKSWCEQNPEGGTVFRFTLPEAAIANAAPSPAVRIG